MKRRDSPSSIFEGRPFFQSRAFLLTHGRALFDEMGDFYTFKYMGAREEEGRDASPSRK